MLGWRAAGVAAAQEYERGKQKKQLRDDCAARPYCLQVKHLYPHWRQCAKLHERSLGDDCCQHTPNCTTDSSILHDRRVLQVSFHSLNDPDRSLAIIHARQYVKAQLDNLHILNAHFVIQFTDITIERTATNLLTTLS